MNDAPTEAGMKTMTPKLIRHESPAGPYWHHPDHPDCQDGQVLHEEPNEVRMERLEDLICGASILMGLFRGYMGPSWFELLHDANLQFPDLIEAEAAVISQLRRP